MAPFGTPAPPELPRAGAVPSSGIPSAALRRTENLALMLQEVLTVATRLQSRSQAVGSPQAFRGQFVLTLRSATQEAARRAYPPQDVEMAAFAVVALIDEVVAGAGNAAFADWVANPLSRELFQVSDSGGLFFRNLDAILARPDSQDLADLLEVYLLVMLLGLRGSRAGDPAGLQHYRDIVGARIRRIRGASYAPVSPYPAPPAPETGRESVWNKRIPWIAGGVVGGALLLFLLFKAILLYRIYALNRLVEGARL